MSQIKANAKMWFVNLQKGTGYSPTCKYIHSDKENIVHFTSQHQRRQTFSPTSLAAGRRVQHQDKPSNNTPWFCSLHTPLRFVSSWLILLLLKFAKPNSWLTWPLNCYTGDIWHSLNCSPNSLDSLELSRKDNVLWENRSATQMRSLSSLPDWRFQMSES